MQSLWAFLTILFCLPRCPKHVRVDLLECVCSCVCVCVSVYVCECMCIYCVLFCEYIYTQALLCAWAFVCVHAFMCVCVNLCVWSEINGIHVRIHDYNIRSWRKQRNYVRAMRQYLDLELLTASAHKCIGRGVAQRYVFVLWSSAVRLRARSSA